jgi:tetraacyldisaccharide 4'-kinase
VDRCGYLRLIRGESNGSLASAARFGLGMAAAGYRLAVALRNVAFDRGWKQVSDAGIPVVAVGNLTLGGTGKTPMVEYVARWYRARGVRVAILSRGYGQSAGINDEGRVLEENLPDVPHLQDRDRVQLARIAVEELESELLVLDDGFQHRRLARALDVVLLDALDPFGQGRLFPRGLLREPIQALRRAQVVVLSRADLRSDPDRAAIRREAERHAGPLRWVEARHAPLDLRDASGQVEPLAELAGRKVAAFCGIGNPEGFRLTLLPRCQSLLGFRTFPDHHPYSAADVADLTHWSRSLGADLVLTTQKDLVKLRALTLGPIPLKALRIGLEPGAGAALLEAALAALLPPGSPGKGFPRERERTREPSA